MGERGKQDSVAGLWIRWILANSVAETVGLGAAFGVGVLLFPYLQAPGLLVALATAGAAVLAGTLIEGTVVGTAQWLVLQRPFPAMRGRAWVLATAAGAFVAWSLGMLSSILMSASSDTGGPETTGAMVYGFTALLGLVAGAILATPQWLVLRRHVRRAAWWVPANGLVWVPGMVLAFYAADLFFSAGAGIRTAVLAISALLAIGAVVGVIHGLALVWLVRLRSAVGEV